jgi:hypothetical protein
MRGGQRSLLGSEDGLQLSVSRPDVGQLVGGTSVRGSSPGQTLVIAQVGGQQAEASLTISPPGSHVVLRDQRGQIIERVDGRERVILPDDVVSTIVPANVGAAERVWIEPGDCTLQIGQQSPRFAVMAAAEGGSVRELAVPLETSDANVLAPDPAAPGRFIAHGFGATQIRALYHGREALANVSVRGNRFLSVNTTLNDGENDFDVTIEVLAAASEGPLEYRAYAAGQTPLATWQPSQPAGPDSRRVVLRSPPMPYKGRSSQYRLILEARDPAGKVQQYPFMFRLVPKLERTDKKAESGKRKGWLRQAIPLSALGFPLSAFPP